MKKSVKKLISVFMVLAIVLSNVSALDYTESQDSQETITEFSYTVYSKDGEIIEQGLIPNGNSRVVWEGIVLDNGERVKLTKSNGNAFSMLNDVVYSFWVQLDRKANMGNSIYRSNYDASKILEPIATWYSVTQSYSRSDAMSHAGYYYFEIKNYSSDPVTIKRVELKF